jgi:hypothetical protein
VHVTAVIVGLMAAFVTIVAFEEIYGMLYPDWTTLDYDRWLKLGNLLQWVVCDTVGTSVAGLTLVISGALCRRRARPRSIQGSADSPIARWLEALKSYLPRDLDPLEVIKL